MAAAKVDVELHSAVVLRPGDALIVGISKAVTEEEVHRIAHRFSAQLDGVRVLVVDNCSGLVVYRGEEKTRIDEGSCGHSVHTGGTHNVGSSGDHVRAADQAAGKGAGA